MSDNVIVNGQVIAAQEAVIDGVTAKVQRTKDGPLTALGNASLALSGSARLLSAVTGGIPAGAHQFDFVPSAAVRYTDDGTTVPSASVGIPVAAGQAWSINTDLTLVKFYGASGQLDGGFYK